MACIGNTHCILANYNTQDLARKLEPLVFPSHYHIKMSLSGCPNDCGKGHFNDFGIVGISKMVYHYERCIDACKKHATGVLSFTEDKKIAKDTCCCVGCGECAASCPVQTISISGGKAHIEKKRCIRCFCCQEMCPVKAIDIRKFRGFQI